MFKDIYKQANDKIDTDAPKSRVMAKLSQTPSPAMKKRYRVTRVAALAACFVLTVAAAGIYENMQREIDTPITLTEKTPKTTAEPDISEDTSDIPEKEPVVQKTAKTSKPARTAVPSTKAALKSSAGTEPVAAVIENSEETLQNEKETSAVVSETPVPTADETPVVAGAGYFPQTEEVDELGASGGGAVAARFSLEADLEKTVLAERFCEEIGKNIPEIVALPQGVTDKTSLKQSIPQGEEKCIFLFAGENKTIQIEANKTAETVQTVIDNPAYEKRYIGESPVLVLEENGTLKGYLVSDSVGYTVTAVNCTENEMEDLLVSLN